MAVLTTERRKGLKSSQFALPGKGEGPGGKGAGSYPIPDASHARNALSRVSQYGSSAEKATVRAAVKRKFPGIGGNNNKKNGNSGNSGNGGRHNNPGGGGGGGGGGAAGAGGMAGGGQAGMAAGPSASARGRGGAASRNNNRIANELGRRLEARSRGRR